MFTNERYLFITYARMHGYGCEERSCEKNKIPQQNIFFRC